MPLNAAETTRPSPNASLLASDREADKRVQDLQLMLCHPGGIGPPPVEG